MQRLTPPDPPTPPAHPSPRWKEVHLFQPPSDLVEALEVAIHLEQPLLLTGEPGVGKTSTAYWAAWCLGLSPSDLVVEQARSDATAARARYEFDAVAYFRESQSAAVRGATFDEDRRRFIREGALWRAFAAARDGRPAGLLVDEIDKAPRDFPNDLLRDFDEFWFEVPELPEGHRDRRVDARRGSGRLRLVVFTSNGERQLPEAFLRRCVHHHIAFDPKHAEGVLRHRVKEHDLQVPAGFVDFALKRFLELRAVPGLRHRPGLSELLVWIRALAATGGMNPVALESAPLGELKHLGILLKEPADLALAKQRR